MIRRIGLVALFLIALLPDEALANCAALPYTFTNGTLADATQVNQDFTTITNCVNGGLITNLGTIATGAWQGTTIGQSWGGTGTALTFNTGSVIFEGSSGFSQDNANLFYDSAHSFLGVGLTAPKAGLHVKDVTSRLSFTGTPRGSVIIEGANSGGQFTTLDFTSGAATAGVPMARIGMQQNNGGGSLLFLGTSNNFASGVTNAALEIDSGGNVAGTTLSASSIFTAGATQLCENANSYIAGFFAITICASDARLKNIVGPLAGGALSRVGKLKPTSFTWKSDSTGAPHSGFIAQDVQTVMPECVTENQDGMLSIETNCILAYQAKAIQELTARLTAAGIK